MVAVGKRGSRNGPGRGCCVAWAKQGQKQRRAPRLDVYDAMLVLARSWLRKQNTQQKETLSKKKQKEAKISQKKKETKNKQGAPTVISFF